MKQDVVIIGAGVVGLATAAAMQKAGRSVLLIDRDQPGAGTSSGNAGHFATEQVFPLADPALLPKIPGMLLDPLGPFRIRLRYLWRALPWFMRFLANMTPTARSRNTRALRALNEDAMAAWQELLEALALSEHLVKRGSLLVFEQAEPEEVHAQVGKYASEGVACRYLTGDEVRELEPVLDGRIQHGIWFTDTGHTPDPFALSKGIWTALEGRGAQYLNAEVTGITSNGEVALADGRGIEAETVILCAGAFSRQLAAQTGHRVPLDTERGYHLMLPAHSGLTRPVASADRSFIITPMAHGTRLAGTVEFAGLTAPMDPRRADILLTHGQALLPGINGEGAERWMGFRPSLPDSLPVMGRAAPGVWFNFGHQHLGLTQAAASADWLSNALHKGDGARLTPFSPLRFR
ncbi:NAD(P)/FAD-dependent oxidoreductase [Ferrimonas balearica]|uniref:NAD(P)/FAD-dependent oxidoreductase n=1 Tax=Ferrimonas balearica TaxID=44012 RepID=UPI001C9964D3|nr:FAD-dependent oxidoreductase [Ferrimonas balearica]MBY5922330.1 FAD-binding oxidoreductase [Ferrimonas balearica]MBY5994330.1 FAD-binding oxidoreductase [Ferrimonas balearica]